METDSYDPWADPAQADDPLDQFRGLTDKHASAMAARELYNRGIYDPVFVGGSNAGGHYWGGGGGGGLQAHLQTPEERQEMAWSNPEAADIAREILQDEKREGLREKITEAVAHYREMLADAHCGSVFSFMKENDESKHYWYAAIKNGDKWYTTAQNPHMIDSDDAFITWLVGLGAHESKATELTQGAAKTALALGPIDTTAAE